MTKYFIILLVIVIVVAIILFFPRKTASKINEVEINDAKIKVEIVDNPYSRYRGLSDREDLCADCGMFFVFPWKATQSFAMRRMKFPLDIIWISDDKIIKIDKNLPPEGIMPKNIYSSGNTVNYVLEVNGGFADKNNIKVGDSIKF
ncbi:MAG: DUF192 domain-containing protein [Patescibacteria group bacterium]|nr:DUF192 domain-containing protein [Patescibacteria group bacterium]MDD4611006.1 DUF192 domain-containing protein [Patescibacteria group bacterium]